MVQLREKDLPGGQLMDLALELRLATEGAASLFLNERVDVALAAGADGVQLGETALSVEATRRVAGGGMLVGRSVHGTDGAEAAAEAGADLLVAGTVYSSRSHPSVAAQGLAVIAHICREVDVPVLGIGGITQENVAEVMGAGASGVAVIGAILGAADPEDAARRLRAAMELAWTPASQGPVRAG